MNRVLHVSSKPADPFVFFAQLKTVLSNTFGTFSCVSMPLLLPAGNNAASQNLAGQSIEQEAASQPVEQEQHAAHAAALSLEAVIEAQSALLQERQHQHQPNMTEEEKKAHRRRSDL